MAESEAPDLGEELSAETAAYLDRTSECVAALDDLLAAYPDGDYRGVVERVESLEADCDRANRRICALVADADVQDLGIRLTRVHLHAGQTVELFHALDEVANAAEQFATDLVAFRPTLSDRQRRALAGMVDRATDAMAALERAVTGYVRVLCDPEASASVAADVDAVRTAESACDRLRTDAVTASFVHEPDAAALVFRELAASLDGVVDAMEDVTDRIVRTTSGDLAVDAEPETAQ